MVECVFGEVFVLFVNDVMFVEGDCVCIGLNGFVMIELIDGMYMSLLFDS